MCMDMRLVLYICVYILCIENWCKIENRDTLNPWETVRQLFCIIFGSFYLAAETRPMLISVAKVILAATHRAATSGNHS
jgi:hypothetical protein